MKIKTTRMIDSYEARKMCITHDYCTMADNDEYSAILDMCHGMLNDNKLCKIAEAIASVSDMQTICESYGCTRTEAIESIAYNIITECCFYDVEAYI